MNIDNNMDEIQRFQDTTGRYFERQPIVWSYNGLRVPSTGTTGLTEEGERPKLIQHGGCVQIPSPHERPVDDAPQTSNPLRRFLHRQQWKRTVSNLLQRLPLNHRYIDSHPDTIQDPDQGVV